MQGGPAEGDVIGPSSSSFCGSHHVLPVAAADTDDVCDPAEVM